MFEVPLSRIVIPENRFRREFPEAALKELDKSIDEIGLLHAIVVEEQADGTFALRAGERRLRVLKARIESKRPFYYGLTEYDGEILPVTSLGELTDLERLQVEVEENVIRRDFTFQERIRAIAALHELRKLQGQAPSATSIASELLGKSAEGSQVTEVSNALIISKHLDDPDVAKAKSAKEAIKIIRGKADREHQAKLAVAYRKQEVVHSLTLGDSRAVLAALPAGTFDVICTDPPYGVGADGFGSMATTTHSYADSKDTFEELAAWLPDELARVSKPASHAYIFCDFWKFVRLHVLMELAGWSCFNVPLIWDKCGTGMLPFPENAPRRTYECILFAWRGGRRTLSIKSDVVRVPAVREHLHAAQKPVALYANLLARSARPGDMVLDCFGGSGPILVAANVLRLRATYVEADEAQYNIALARQSVSEFDDGAREDDGIAVAL